jgi:probable rRNA maturation factor
MRQFAGVSITGATPSLRRTVYYLVHTLLTLERAPHDAQLRVHFVSMQHMCYLNRTFKGINRPTDVLTFTPAGAADSCINDLLFGDANTREQYDPTSTSNRIHGCGGQPVDVASIATASFSSSAAATFASVASLSHSIVRSELVELGDMFISLDYMQRRCAAFPSRSLPLAPYLHAAVVHATLHALGYDHTTPQELQQMVRREQHLGHRIAVLSRRCPGYLPPLDIWDSPQ